MRRAQRRPEITPGYDRRTNRTARRGARRSTKAGDYPRLRPPPVLNPYDRGHTAQRRPEITPGYDRPTTRPRPRRGCALNEGRRLPPATTNRPVLAGGISRALNEGRRLPPATTRRRLQLTGGIVRSTKAGDYPRLRLLSGQGRGS